MRPYPCFVICAYAVSPEYASCRLVVEALSGLAELTSQDAAELMGSVHGIDRVPRGVLENGFFGYSKTRVVSTITEVDRDRVISRLFGTTQLRRRTEAGRLQALPPISFDFTEGNVTVLGERVRHSCLMLSVPSAVFAGLEWSAVGGFMRSTVLRWADQIPSMSSLFVDYAWSGKHAAGRGYVSEAILPEELNFRLEQASWEGMAPGRPELLRGVFWANHLSKAQVSRLGGRAQLQRWLTGRVRQPEKTGVRCHCIETPCGGLYVETAEMPCRWPRLEPWTVDAISPLELYSCCRDAGLLAWR
jgi:hypothetical protein